MSLTSILKSPLRANLAAWFKHHFPNDVTANNLPIVVNKSVFRQLDYSRIGTGFDYLFRFQLERINLNHRQAPRKWIAEYGLELVLHSLAGRAQSGRSEPNQRLATRLVSEFEEAKRTYQAFISSGILATEVVRSSLFLAKLDVVYRTGKTKWVFMDQPKEEAAEIEHLKKLFYAVNWEPFTAQHQCVLNPEFGRAGALVGGADADIIIDGVLIDVKVTRTSTLQRAYLNQLIGYYLLSLMHTNDCEPIYPIHTIALYFPRANYLLKIPVTHFFDKAGFQQRKVEFISLVRDRNLDLVDWQNNEYLFTDTSAVKYRVNRQDFKCPYCQADKYSIKALGETNTGRYKYKCTSCKKGFSTVFAEGRPVESVIRSLLFRNRFDYEEIDCLEKQLNVCTEGETITNRGDLSNWQAPQA